MRRTILLSVTAAAALAFGLASSGPQPFDLVIEHARVVDGTGWESGSATQCHDLPFSVRVGKCGYRTELSGGAARRRERRIAACPFAPFECRHVGRERRKRVAFIPKTCHP